MHIWDQLGPDEEALSGPAHVDDPIAKSGESSSLCAYAKGEDLGRVHPHGSLETSGKGSHVEERHDGSRDTAYVCIGSLVIDLMYQAGHNGEDGCHESDRSDE